MRRAARGVAVTAPLGGPRPACEAGPTRGWRRRVESVVATSLAPVPTFATCGLLPAIMNVLAPLSSLVVPPCPHPFLAPEARR